MKAAFDLFGQVPPPAPPQWQGLGGGPGGRNWAWRHVRTGVMVRHCGHPTALRPYYVTIEEGGTVLALRDLGTFSQLRDAQAAAVSWADRQGGRHVE